MTASDESVLKLKSPAEVTSGDADVVFPTGSYVECLTALETTYSGQVLRFDAPSRMLVIKDSSGVKPVMRFINLAFVREVNTRERPTEFTPYTIQLPSIEQLNERIRCSEELKRVSIMQAHVSLEGQRAFISLQKILGDVRWEGECIIVLGRIRVNPPYSADSVEATLDAASSRSVRAKEHVCKILLKLTRAQLSSSSENVKSDADQARVQLL